MTMEQARLAVLAASRAMLGRTDVNFAGTSPAAGLVCTDVFVLACEQAGIPIRDMMRRLYRQNPAAYPPDSGPPTDVNFTRRVRNVVAFLTALGLWYPGKNSLPGRLIAFADAGRLAHAGVVGRAGGTGSETVVMATSYGGPPAAVREVNLPPYLIAHPEFSIAGYGDPPIIKRE